MADVRFEQATRIYPGTSTPAVDALDLHVEDGEFIVLVGPSGSGKTTALRMLAGLEEVDEGGIYIGGRDVTYVPAKNRDVAMVFQNYALYPYLTVAANIAFPLRVAKVPKAEREQRMREVAEMLGLSEYLERRPGQLSGGQRQRVAMGRAIVRNPSVYLMDEPLSNLDAKLRVQTRTEVVELQARLGVTTVYVTHDQVEAMTMGHRVAVLKDGVLQQCDTPQTLYHEPINLFVAGFIGSPAMNLVDVGEERPLRLGGATIALAPDGEAALAGEAGPVTIGFRPEALQAGDGPLRAQIRSVEDLGPEVFVHVYLEHQAKTLPLVSKMFPPFDAQPGDTVGLQITGATHLFAADGSRIASTTATLDGTSAPASETAEHSSSTS